MFIDQHPYVSIYLLGSILVIILTFVKITLFYTVDWITKANILTKNLKKIAEPDNNVWYIKTLKFIGVLLFEAALSWINVVVLLVQIPYTLFKVLRDLLASVPEEVKALRFPLRNNPMLSKEAVWAYLMALNVKMGVALQNESGIVASLEDVLENRPDFNYQDALEQLDNLKVMNSEIIASVKNSFIPKDDEYEDYNEFVYDPAEEEDDWHSELQLYPDLKQYTTYSRTPDYSGQYTTLYEYKIEDKNIYSRVIESKNEYYTEVDYDIKDNVVLETEVRERMSKSRIMSSQEDIESKITELKKEIEWQEVPSRFKYFIMLRHRDIFNSADLKKYYRSELQRLKSGYTALEQEVIKIGGYIVPFDKDDILSYMRIRWDEDLSDDKVAMLHDISSNTDQYSISYYEFSNLEKITDELSSYLNKLG